MTDAPHWPLGQWTTFELRARREELEREVGELPLTDLRHAGLMTGLEKVRAEERARAEARNAPIKWQEMH